MLVSVCLPSLKYLTLVLVSYIDNATLPRLLSGCPNLEELFVDQLEDDGTEDVTVVMPSLKRLTMSDKNSNAMGAPSLKYLSITHEVDYMFREIETMPELVEAYVDITQSVTQKFMRALTSVCRLSLCLSLPKITHPSGIVFNRLVHLKLCSITDGWWDLLTLMLQDSPKLQTLILDSLWSSWDDVETPIGWKPPSSIPECMMFSLEAFVWIGYKGTEGDRVIATYVLKNAACLKTTTISPVSTDVVEKYKMLKELASVPTSYACIFVSAFIRLIDDNTCSYLGANSPFQF